MFDFVCKLQASEQSKFNFVLFCIPEIQGLSFANCARDHKSKCNSINFRPSDALFSPFSQQFKYPKNEDKSKAAQVLYVAYCQDKNSAKDVDEW